MLQSFRLRLSTAVSVGRSIPGARATVHRAFAAIGGVGLIALWGLVLIDIRVRRQEVRIGRE